MSLQAAEVRGEGAQVLTTVNTCCEQDFALWLCPKVPLLPSLGGMRRDLPTPGQFCSPCEHIQYSLKWAKGWSWAEIITDTQLGDFVPGRDGTLRG